MPFKPILEGIVLGISLSILVGPAFFALLNISIRKGFVFGVLMAIGISMSDSIIIFSSYFGLSSLITNIKAQLILGMAGGSILIIFGITTFRKRIRFRDMRPRPTPLNKTRIFKYISQGFVLNITNPFVWLFWLGTAGLVHSNYGRNTFNAMAFFVSILATILFFDIIKSYLANQVKKLTRPKTMLLINKLAGAIMVILGFVLILRVTMLFFT